MDSFDTDLTRSLSITNVLIILLFSILENNQKPAQKSSFIICTVYKHT